MNPTEKIIRESINRSDSRLDLWIYFLNSVLASVMVEVGVYKGDFASAILKGCRHLEKYYMVDPWRHLEDWNKPVNSSDEDFSDFLSETRAKTDFAAEKRVILRGTTTEMVEEIPDGELDFAYIDGDHTLRGISIDLIRLYPKVKVGGWIGGDDFHPSVWNHSTIFEPTLVFPFAVYFAEAVGAQIYALPYSQFLIEKSTSESYAFVDLTGQYSNVNLREQIHPITVLKQLLKESVTSPMKIARRVKHLIEP